MAYEQIPTHAKLAAARALEQRRKLPTTSRFGLDRKTAKEYGVASGVERAKQIIREQKVTSATAQRIANFYSRFKGCKTSKCEGAINLWGGRRWGKELSKKY